MLRHNTTLPLQADEAHRFLPWLIALMVYLAALALAGAFVLEGAVGQWRTGWSDTLTVQLPPTEDVDARVEAAVGLLRGEPGVAGARALTREELHALLEPWLGDAGLDVDLPVPRLIDVTLAEGATVDAVALEAKLQATAPGATVDDHAVWLDRLADTARALQLVTFAVMAAIGVAAVGTLVFTTRTSLVAHHDAIEVLHLIGARDAFVASAFAWQALRLGLKGGLIGLGLAGITLLALYSVVTEVEALLLPRLTLSAEGMIAIAALPLASALIAMVTARATVMRALGRMP